MTASMAFAPRTLGRTDLRVSPLGLASGGGTLPAREVERAFDRGINTFYWGTLRASSLAEGIRTLAKSHRDEMVVVVQSYSRSGAMMRGSVERALTKLGVAHADLLLLGWWTEPPPARIVDAARSLRDRGLAKHLVISSHNRRTFEAFASDPTYDGIMVRYNAVHPGAETEVFPKLGDPRPGVISYTATRWGHLLDPAALPKDEHPPRGSDCYRFVLTAPAVDLAVCAPRDAAELDEALATIDRGPMSPDELAWMKRVGAHVKVATAGRRTFNPIEMLDKVAGWFAADGKSKGSVDVDAR